MTWTVRTAIIVVMDTDDITCAEDLIPTDVGYLAVAGVGGVIAGHWASRWEVEEKQGTTVLVSYCNLYMGRRQGQAGSG